MGRPRSIAVATMIGLWFAVMTWIVVSGLMVIAERDTPPETFECRPGETHTTQECP